MLNSDGELEEDYETHAERYARTLALAEVYILCSSNSMANDLMFILFARSIQYIFCCN